MARDSQAALVALNRFGFGARGGASGDFVNAASDPRGFVKAELGRPNGVLLEVPGLQSTPALGKAVFDYQFEIQQARDAAAKAAPAAATEAPQPPPDAKAQRRNLSLNSIAMDITAKEPPAKQPAKPPDNAPMAGPSAPAETMQPNAPKPPPQPLNIIQKTFRAEALARLQRGIIADCGFAERLVVFWSNHFCISANKGGLARMWAGSFEREAIRPHVLGRFGDMLKAVEQHPAMLFFLDNQQSLGPDSRAGQKPQPRPERKSRPRDHGAAYARRRRRLFAGRRDVAGAHHHRLDLCGTAGPARRARHLRVQRQCASARRAAGDGQDLRGQRRGAGRGGAGGYRAPSVDREIHRHQIRAPLRGRRSAAGAGGAACRRVRASPTATSRRWRRRWWIPTRPGRRR